MKIRKVTPLMAPLMTLFPKNELKEPASFAAFVTPDDARSILEACTPQYQRNQNDEAIKLLMGEMSEGKFEPTGIIFGVVREDDKNIFINIDGRTRLSAIAASSRGQWLFLMFTPYSDHIAVRKAYGRIDRQRARTFKDWLRANGVLDGVILHRPIENKLHGIAQTLHLDFKAGRSGYRGDSKIYDIHEAIIRKILNAAVIYGELVKSTNASRRKIFENVPVASVGIHLIHTYGEPAIQFWAKVITDDCISSDSYEKKLSLKLADMWAEGRSDIANARRVRACEYVWNKMCKGKRIKVVKISSHTSQVAFESP